MSRWSAAWSALTGRGFIPNQPPTSDTAGLVQRLQPWSAPPRRAAVEAPHAYLVHPILRMVAGKIATSVSRHVPKLYRVNAKGEKTEVFDHPALDLLRHPNDILTGLETRKLTQLYLDLAGENFWLLWANADGEPVRLFPLPPRWVVQVPDENRRSFRVSFQNLQMEIPAASILWMRDVNPESPYGRGTGITEALGDEIDVDEYAARYVKAFFYNRASPEIIVSAEGAKPEETARAKAKWDDEHRGWWNGFKTFWTGSKISVTRLDTTFRDSQLTELRAYQRDLIISTFGVPPEVLGIIENSNRATIDASSALYAEHVIEPRLAIRGVEGLQLPQHMRREHEVAEHVLVLGIVLREAVVPEAIRELGREDLIVNAAVDLAPEARGELRIEAAHRLAQEAGRHRDGGGLVDDRGL